MNERIKALLEQAGVKTNCHGQPIPSTLASNFDEVVELIIRECCCIADNTVVGMPSDDIKEHFGVEE